jgi:hypothetical protein
MSADPVTVLAVLLAYLRRHTLLSRLPAGQLLPAVRLVEQLLVAVRIRPERDPLAGIMLSAVAKTRNPLVRRGTGRRRRGPSYRRPPGRSR